MGKKWHKAVVCLSGGQDSSTLLWFAKQRNDEVYALSFDYGQRHKCELEYAKKLAELAGIEEHKILKFDLTQIGNSPLTDVNIEVPKQETGQQATTNVPWRNTILSALAAGYAYNKGAHILYYGPNAEDEANYPDCRQNFFNALRKTLNLGTPRDDFWLAIYTPFIKMKKPEIVKIGLQLGVPYEWSWTCYNGKEMPCIITNNNVQSIHELNKIDPTKACDADYERWNAFIANGIYDPLVTRLLGASERVAV